MSISSLELGESEPGMVEKSGWRRERDGGRDGRVCAFVTCVMEGLTGKWRIRRRRGRRRRRRRRKNREVP